MRAWLKTAMVERVGAFRWSLRQARAVKAKEADLMPHIRRRKAMAMLKQPPEEIGRAGWVLVGAATMAAGALLHAVAGFVEIVREMMGGEPPTVSEPGTKPTTHDRAQPGLGRWIVSGAVLLGATTLAHAVAALVKSIKGMFRARGR
ncbi:hypothetical protein [Streptomyces sp. AB3(2024)]|uniref:hypothetical protein n=1 Tax=Streptomyces sp. AB3(2024) TaxID=3317321 RepID=UPI0035A38654